mgnify:FL=1
MAVTSTTATTAIDVCNRALVLIGASPMTSFEDGTNEALVAVNLYEDTCRSTLVNTRWRFASNQKILNRLSDEPTGRFDSAYSLPSDAIYIHTLTVNKSPIKFDIYGKVAFCDATINDEVIADYSFRQTEVNFPSYFVQALVYELAGQFALGIARDEGSSNMMFNNARFYMQKARTMDSQQQTTKKLITNRFIVERRS